MLGTRVGTIAHGAVAAGLAATLGGCFWPAPGGGPDRTAHNALETAITVDTVGSLHPVWSAPTDGPAGDPVTSTAGVHVDGDQTTYGFGTDGSELWSVTLPAEYEELAELSSVVARDGRVLAVHRARAGFEEVAQATAGVWFDARTGGDLGPGPVADSVRGDLAAGSRTDYLDGVFSETLQIADPDSGTAQVLDGGLLSLWFLDSPRPAPTHVTLGAGAVFQSGPGLPSDQQGIADLGVRAFPRQGGARNCGPQPAPFFACPTWVTELTATSTTAVVVSPDQATLYLGVDAVLYVLDATTGAVQWTAPMPSTVADAPAVAGDRVFVPTSGGELAVLAAGGCGSATCAPAWTGSTGSAVTVQPAVAGSGAGAVVITGGADGGLDAFPAAGCGAATCAPSWSGAAGAPITGAPAVSNGRVYVGTEAGIVAFGL